MRSVKTSFFCLFAIFIPLFVSSQVIKTIAGNGSATSIGDGAPAAYAGIYLPCGGTFDKHGNYYVGQGPVGCRVRKITPLGIVTTIAGSGVCGSSAGDGGPATAAIIKNAQAVAVDAFDNLYIADLYDNRIRKVDAVTGIITTIAGTGTGGYNGDGIPATAAELFAPADLCVDHEGSLYIADAYNWRVRKINSAGFISTVAGRGVSTTYVYGGDGGPADTTTIGTPYGICFDETGNLFIANRTSRVMKVNTTGTITTYAGGDIGGSSGDGNPATAAVISPYKIAMDKNNNLYLAEYYTSSNKVRMVSNSGIITTVVGTGMSGYSGDNGLATAAQLNYPSGVAIDTCGNVYIADAWNNRIREVLFYPTCPDTTGSDTTLATSISLASGDIALFPNPVYEVLHIHGIPATATYTISDMTGKASLHGVVQKGSIPVKNLPSGMYLITIFRDDERVVRKFLKE